MKKVYIVRVNIYNNVIATGIFTIQIYIATIIMQASIFF